MGSKKKLARHAESASMSREGFHPFFSLSLAPASRLGVDALDANRRRDRLVLELQIVRQGTRRTKYVGTAASRVVGPERRSGSAAAFGNATPPPATTDSSHASIHPSSRDSRRPSVG